MGTLNLEVDDVRAGQMDLYKMVGDLRNHFYSLQACYMMFLVNKKGVRNLNYFFGFLLVVALGVASYKTFN